MTVCARRSVAAVEIARLADEERRGDGCASGLRSRQGGGYACWLMRDRALWLLFSMFPLLVLGRWSWSG